MNRGTCWHTNTPHSKWPAYTALWEGGCSSPREWEIIPFSSVCTEVPGTAGMRVKNEGGEGKWLYSYCCSTENFYFHKIVYLGILHSISSPDAMLLTLQLRSIMASVIWIIKWILNSFTHRDCPHAGLWWLCFGEAPFFFVLSYLCWYFITFSSREENSLLEQNSLEVIWWPK